jgi:hypothetical protein
MSKELADKVGLVEGGEAIFITEMAGVKYLKAVTVVDVFDDGNGDIRVNCEEFGCDDFGGYVLPRDLYSKEKIMRMLGEHDYIFKELMIVGASGIVIGIAIGCIILSVL